jgi:hypothetical protein
VRPTDAWDLCPLPVALAAILIGIKLARLDFRLLAMIGVSYKRDLVIALAVGALVELALSAWVSLHPENHRQPEWLQEPALRIGLAIYRYSYSHIGNPGSIYVSTICAYMVVIAISSAGAFALLRVLGCLTRRT